MRRYTELSIRADQTMKFPKWTGNSIVQLSLHKRASALGRLDVLPFIAFYVFTCFHIAFNRLSRFSAISIMVTLFLLHILALLAQQWSVCIRVFLSWASVNELRKGDVLRREVFALCKPREHRGKPELVPLETDEQGRVFFVFQKRTYEFDPVYETFRKIDYPTDYRLRHYASHARVSGGLSNDHLVHALTKYGPNKLEMPAPTFIELYKQALLAPFFVFQVFCIFLWLLDEYWKYSLMTLLMMLLFEATVVQGRLRSLRELRGMRNPVVKIYVYRNKRWTQTTSLGLLPGDIVSICRSRDASQVVPCDLLILSGTAVVNEAMLTGESVPLMKESISSLDGKDLDQVLSIKEAHKGLVLFGGTRVLTNTPGIVTQYTPSAKCPDGGCVCYVLRTGFGSSQGKLMRTILFSTESVSANSSEAALFILFLLAFAVAASGYVLYHRYTDDLESRYKLLLRCVLIITSVVPPELPMQLALAVNTSLIALVKNMIFCTEPYRIPYAGKVDICCFDKTGTLTTDSINAVGVVMPSCDTDSCSFNFSTEESKITPVRKSSIDASLVLAACHSLVYVDHDLVGDPLELAALNAIHWHFSTNNVCVPRRGGSTDASAKILKRFRFASSLQRMSVIVDINGKLPRNGPRVLVKGSPEAVGRLLLDGMSDDYKLTARRLARAGMRVLALAYKNLGTDMTLSQATKMRRDEAEEKLTFAGFVCFECPVRCDSRKAVRTLKKANHMVTMITGDSTLTAAHVATQVGMCTKRILILSFSEVVPGSLEWFSASSGKRLKRFSAETVEQLAVEFDLCVGGSALHAAMAADADMRTQLRYIKVFARMSPEQKESVLAKLKESGLITLMCGDGTNDVGALKQAHVGVALLSTSSSHPKAEEVQSNVSHRSQVGGDAGGHCDTRSRRGSDFRQRRKPFKANYVKDKSEMASLDVCADVGRGSHTDRYAKRMQELTESVAESEEQPPLVKLGDASVASPFTSRRMSIDSCVSIIRQGRCTLATTLQMYQILALNCLISAYSLSVLYLEGVMLGDKQMTITGLVLAVASFMVSRSKPLKKLSPERPATTVFATALFLSMMGQFAIHVTGLIMCMRLVKPFSPSNQTPDLIEEFSPSLLNSVVFLLSIAQQISVYVINYKGRPHMEGISENRPLLYSLLAATGILTACTLEISSDMNSFMELVPWPSTSLQAQVGGVILFDLVGSFVVDRTFAFLFTPRVKMVT